jgi:hypothetical protein
MNKKIVLVHHRVVFISYKTSWLLIYGGSITASYSELTGLYVNAASVAHGCHIIFSQPLVSWEDVT